MPKPQLETAIRVFNSTRAPTASVHPGAELYIKEITHLIVDKGPLFPRIQTESVFILWCIRGRYKDQTEHEGVYTIPAGHFGIVFPNRALSAHVEENNTELYSLELKGAYAEKTILNAGLYEGIFQNNCPPIDWLKDLCTQLKSPPEKAQSKALSTFDFLLSETAAQARANAADPLVHDALHLMHTHFSNAQTNVQLIAGQLRIGRNTLLKRFKQTVGTSPIRYLSALRLSTACRLLQTTEQPITDIAATCGIPDAVYFSQFIKKHTGLSPRNYRNAAMNGK